MSLHGCRSALESHCAMCFAIARRGSRHNIFACKFGQTFDNVGVRTWRFDIDLACTSFESEFEWRKSVAFACTILDAPKSTHTKRCDISCAPLLKIPHMAPATGIHRPIELCVSAHRRGQADTSSVAVVRITHRLELACKLCTAREATRDALCLPAAKCEYTFVTPSVRRSGPLYVFSVFHVARYIISMACLPCLPP